MNKYQEALDNVKADRRDVIGSSEDGYIPYTTLDEIKLLQELVDRATPMKPLIDDEQPYCPLCKTTIYNGKGIMAHYTDYYCTKCGQAIDWSMYPICNRIFNRVFKIRRRHFLVKVLKKGKNTR